jgi:Zn-dependent peptidase ImmA (M78 family)/transcriptional regulator with XRE-family HTH domain
MRHEPVVGIEPRIMQWARKTIGLSVEQVASKLKRPVSSIEAWESGTEAPSYTELEKLAYNIYKRPLAVFFLPEPPDEVTPIKEFRTLPDIDLQTLYPDTYLQIRHARAYQLALNELFEGENPVIKPIWQYINLYLEKDIAEQAQTIRKFLSVDIKDQIKWVNDEDALKHWRQAVEETGVFVFKNAFKQKEISGFCLIDENFPIIYLNNSTTKTRQIFSLLHELAHLLLNINGISKFDTTYIERLLGKEKAIEIFCNAIAAEILIPAADFSEKTNNLSANIEDMPDEYFSKLANQYGVSREAILRRIMDQKRINPAFYEQKAKYWTSQKKQGKGGNWYASQGTYLSSRFSKEVISRYYHGQVTIEQAADFLGINVKNFAGIEQKILSGGDV